MPTWIKNNAGWWANGQIDDTSFIQSIQFLIENRIIKINQKFDENLINFVITADLAVNANTKENLKNIEKVAIKKKCHSYLLKNQIVKLTN